MNANFNYIRELITKDGISFWIRPASPNDTESIQNNIDTVCAEKVYLYTDRFVITEEWEKVLANSVDEEKGYLLIVTEVEKEVIGHLRVFPGWYGEKGRHVGDIGIIILKKWRGRGIGFAMLSYVIEWAKFTKFRKLTASIINTNQPAINLFSKSDFVTEGLRFQQLNLSGQLVDESLLAIFLDWA